MEGVPLFQLLRNRDIDGIKRLIVNTSNAFDLLEVVCQQGHDDDFSLIGYFLAMGACRMNNALHSAASYDKPKMLRALLDAGINVNRLGRSGKTAFHFAMVWNCRQCIKVLIDAGATPPVDAEEWITEYIDERSTMRSSCIVMMALNRCRSAYSGANKDVLRMIARCVWSARGH